MKNRNDRRVALRNMLRTSLRTAPALCLPLLIANASVSAIAAPVVTTSKAPSAKTPSAKAPAKAPVKDATPKPAPNAALSTSSNAAPATSSTQIAPAVASVAAPEIAVSVNNDKLSRADLDRLVGAIKAGDKSLQTGTPQATQALAAVRQNQIDNWIYNRLLTQEVNKRRITPAAADVDAQMKNFRASFPTAAAYQAFLKGANKTEANLRQFYIELLAQDELSKRLSADVTISDAQVKAFYDAPPAYFPIPLQARASQILLAIPEKASADDKAKIKARADDILKKAQAPNADFVALVTQYSEDPSAKETKGDTDEFVREEVAPPMKAFADAVFGAKAGQILGPIETPFGLHIVRVDEAPHKARLDADFKSTIRAILLQKAVGGKLDEIVANARKTAVIKINS